MSTNKVGALAQGEQGAFFAERKGARSAILRGAFFFVACREHASRASACVSARAGAQITCGKLHEFSTGKDKIS